MRCVRVFAEFYFLVRGEAWTGRIDWLLRSMPLLQFFQREEGRCASLRAAMGPWLSLVLVRRVGWLEKQNSGRFRAERRPRRMSVPSCATIAITINKHHDEQTNGRRTNKLCFPLLCPPLAEKKEWKRALFPLTPCRFRHRSKIHRTAAEADHPSVISLLHAEPFPRVVHACVRACVGAQFPFQRLLTLFVHGNALLERNPSRHAPPQAFE